MKSEKEVCLSSSTVVYLYTVQWRKELLAKLKKCKKRLLRVDRMDYI